MSWWRTPYSRSERKESYKHNRSQIEREVLLDELRQSDPPIIEQNNETP